jgi:hypothetical protein
MVEQTPPWEAPKDANGGIDWHAMPSALPPRTPDMDFRTPEQRSEDIRLLAKSSEDTRRAEEAKLEAAKLKSGVPIPPRWHRWTQSQWRSQ